MTLASIPERRRLIGDVEFRRAYSFSAGLLVGPVSTLKQAAGLARLDFCISLDGIEQLFGGDSIAGGLGRPPQRVDY